MADDESDPSEQFEHAQRLALDEYRRRLDNQVKVFEGVDDKALRTVRTSVLILGVVASTVGIAGPERLSAVSNVIVLYVGVGVMLLFAAAFGGIGSYAATKYDIGPPMDTLDPDSADDGAEWVATAVEEYSDVVRETGTRIQQNSEYVVHSQLAMLVGVTMLLTAAGMLVLSQSYGIPPAVQLISLAAATTLEVGGVLAYKWCKETKQVALEGWI